MSYALRAFGIVLAAALATVAGPLGALSAGADALVLDADAGSGLDGAVFTVDLATGARSVLSDLGLTDQGPTAANPAGIATTASGAILVVDRTGGTSGAGRLLRVDPVTGARVLVSDFGNSAQGSVGSRPTGLAVETSGTVLVADPSAGRARYGALFRVNPTNGVRTTLSNFGNPRQGPLGDDPVAVSVTASGAILVVDPSVGTGGALFAVDPATGRRRLVSDFGDRSQGPTGNGPAGVTVDSAGAILVVDPSAGPALNGALFRVDAVSGARTVLSDFGDASQGPTGISPSSVVVDASGTIFVTDPGVGDGGVLFRVDPVSGARTVVSDLSSAASGPLGEYPVGIALPRPTTN